MAVFSNIGILEAENGHIRPESGQLPNREKSANRQTPRVGSCFNFKKSFVFLKMHFILFLPVREKPGAPPPAPGRFFSPCFWTFYGPEIHHSKDGLCIFNGYGDMDVLIFNMFV